MDQDIQIIEKPEWISWDQIHDFVWMAHKDNREKGIIMRFPSLSGDRIRKKIGNEGRMYVIIHNNQMIGTGAWIRKHGHDWWCDSDYAYYCFDSIHPDYRGLGIYKYLCNHRDRDVIASGLNISMFDTNEKNLRELSIARKEGYRLIDYKNYQGHYNVVVAKWLNGCPFSKFRCNVEFIVRKAIVRSKGIIKGFFAKH